MRAIRVFLPSLLLALCPLRPAIAQETSFFVTSEGTGKGGDLGGLEGADRHCEALATKAGLPSTGWRAYLSTQAMPPEVPVHARDRIGPGPWHNAKGGLIASTLEALHGLPNAISRATALDERGEPVPGKVHDILTGTRLDGTAPSPLDPDSTCRNWTRNSDEGGALVGHHDRVSAIDQPWATSWNSAHVSRGCSVPKLAELGSGGRFYCFRAHDQTDSRE
ncbi:MAG: hypothetical protein KF800_13590 [Lysobacter sp.]|nr:hypothetical protein [Lysobacter sp.]